MKRTILAPIFALALLASLLTATPVSAHRSPVGCSGSALGIVLYASVQQVPIGGTVLYSVTVFNGTGVGPVACDAINIVASIITPDGISHPINLSRTTLLNGQLDNYTDVVAYVAREQDVVGGILAATASDAGDIHQNDTDSRGGGFQGLNVTISVTPPPVVVVDNPGGGSFAPQPKINVVKTAMPIALTAGPGLVRYTYAVTNVAVVPMIGVWAKDDKCVPVTYMSGDTNKDTLLDRGEIWLFQCSKVLEQTETNIVTVHGQANGWDTYDTDTATVTVSSAVLPPVPVFPTIVPTFPDTGIEPVPSVPVPVPAPTRLIIPAIGVSAAVEVLGATAKGAMAAPKGPVNVGWFSFGVKPGEIGSAVIDGHSGWYKKQPAVFDRLAELRPGDEISVFGDNGAVSVFAVREVKTFAWNESTHNIFVSRDGKAHLNLITCGGAWDTVLKMFSRRVVVFADLIQ